MGTARLCYELSTVLQALNLLVMQESNPEGLSPLIAWLGVHSAIMRVFTWRVVPPPLTPERTIYLTRNVPSYTANHNRG